MPSSGFSTTLFGSFAPNSGTLTRLDIQVYVLMENKQSYRFWTSNKHAQDETPAMKTKVVFWVRFAQQNDAQCSSTDHPNLSASYLKTNKPSSKDIYWSKEQHYLARVHVRELNLILLRRVLNHRQSYYIVLN